MRHPSKISLRLNLIEMQKITTISRNSSVFSNKNKLVVIPQRRQIKDSSTNFLFLTPKWHQIYKKKKFYRFQYNLLPDWRHHKITKIHKTSQGPRELEKYLFMPKENSVSVLDILKLKILSKKYFSILVWHLTWSNLPQKKYHQSTKKFYCQVVE